MKRHELSEPRRGSRGFERRRVTRSAGTAASPCSRSTDVRGIERAFIYFLPTLTFVSGSGARLESAQKRNFEV